jgi:phosphatidylserine decarboxylase
MTDMLEPNPNAYENFNAFFTRALKPNARPINTNAQTIISPIDGKIGQIGTVNNNLMITAKGKSFTLDQLLANNQEALLFRNANFAVLYLAPSNYHRIHMPTQGKLRSMRYIPGKLFSVNPNIVNCIPGVFAKNERVIINFATTFGPMTLILVGAMIVGSIETPWAGVVMPNNHEDVTAWDYTDQNIIFEPGQEIGNFKLGSTVILLFPEKTMHWDKIWQIDRSIKMGQNLGEFQN